MEGQLESVSSSSYGRFLQNIKKLPHAAWGHHVPKQLSSVVETLTCKLIRTMILTSLASVTAMTEPPPLQGAGSLSSSLIRTIKKLQSKLDLIPLIAL